MEGLSQYYLIYLSRIAHLSSLQGNMELSVFHKETRCVNHNSYAILFPTLLPFNQEAYTTNVVQHKYQHPDEDLCKLPSIKSVNSTVFQRCFANFHFNLLCRNTFIHKPFFKQVTHIHLLKMPYFIVHSFKYMFVTWSYIVD